MAIYIGPAGIALLGNFNNIVGILTTFSNGAISSGITKYISQYESEEEKRSIVSHALKITLVCSVLLGVVVVALKDVLSKMTFGNTEYISETFGITVKNQNRGTQIIKRMKQNRKKQRFCLVIYKS